MPAPPRSPMHQGYGGFDGARTDRGSRRWSSNRDLMKLCDIKSVQASRVLSRSVSDGLIVSNNRSGPAVRYTSAI
jgi:hypothetical protein